MNSQKTNVSLKPIRGKEQDLLELDVVEGALLIATDTGKMYMDANGKRVSVGGSGSPFIYAEAEGLEPDEYGTYTLSFDDLESEDMLPQVDGLIINSDGTFFRILEVNAEEQTMLCMIIAVSGTGGGSGTGAGKAIAIKGKPLKTVSLVNGQKMSAFFTATSATYSAGGSYTNNGTATLYAVWKAKEYSVLYNGNGGTHSITGSETWEDTTNKFTFGKEYNISLETLGDKDFKYPGYNLLGWNTSGTATEPLTTLKIEKDEQPQLYAIWELGSNIRVYTNENWQIAIPYVYENGEWKLSISKVFNNEAWRQ